MKIGNKEKELKKKIEIFTIESKKKKYEKGYFDTFLKKLNKELNALDATSEMEKKK